MNRFNLRPLLTYSLLLIYALLIGIIAINAVDRTSWNVLVTVAIIAGCLLVWIQRTAALSAFQILIIALLLRAAFFFLPPSLSDDAYRYVWDGMVQAEGINPYLYHPSDSSLAAYHEAPIYEVLNSKEYFSVYPPVSQYIFRTGGAFYEQGWEVSYYVIKIILMLFEIAALLILAQLVAPRLLILYAWHPLVLMETAGQAHTESAMLFFLVLAVWFARKRWGIGASMALACAGWVKLYPYVFLPLLWQRFKWKGLIPGGLTALVLLLPFYHPQLIANILDSLNLYVRFFEFNAGFYYSIKKVYLIFTGDDWSKFIGPALRRLFLVGLPAIYFIDYWKKWPLEKALLVIAGYFLICSTTIHPWYFLGILILAVMQERMPWHWYWVATIALGTYLLYIDGPYWPFVIVGWGGWFLIGLIYHREKPVKWLRDLQQFRAQRKVQAIEKVLGEIKPGPWVLDLGAGEGYVGAEIARKWGAKVRLADVVDMNKSTLPHTKYDGRRLPFRAGSYDTTILYFVLHHAEQAEKVIKEALRVTRGQVIVVESVYEATWDLKLLTFLDVWANRLRSGGMMNAQEAHLHFRKSEDWVTLFENSGAEVIKQQRKGRWIHKQHFFILKPHRRKSSSGVNSKNKS